MKTKLLILTLSIFACVSLSAQEYLQMIDEGTHSVAEVIESAENYFADKDKGRGTGYKQFKRWEYMAKRLMNENGYLTPAAERLQELEDYNAYLNETSSERAVLNDNWEELGPSSWNSTTAWSPGVGRVTGIGLDLNNQDHFIIGANTGGVWRTVDAGSTWTPLSDYFANLYVYSVAIAPSDPDTYFFGSYGGLIYKSTDAGATWNQLGTAGTSFVNKILIHPTDPDIMYATSQNTGIFRSADGGATWSEVANNDSRGYDVEFKPGDPNTVYASGINFHVSTDGGTNWTNGAGFASGAKMIAITPADADRVYVVEANGGSFGGLYTSTDSGANFTELNHAGRNYFGYDTAGFDPGGQAPRDMDIAVSPVDADEVHIAGVLTWRSTDGGANFSITSDWIPGQAAGAGIGYCHADVDILEFYPNGQLYVGTDGGIFIAENTTTVDPDYYTDLTDGIGIRQWYKIGVSQTNDVIISGGSQDNGTSFYSATTGEWIDWIGADGMETFIDKDNPLTMYGTSQTGQLYRTDNGANSISYLPEPPPGSGNWVTPFEQDPEITNTIYLGYRQIYSSPSKGNFWNAISQDLGGSQDNLKIAPSNNQVMYASRASILYKTEDGGATDWVQMTTPGGINSIAIHPSNPDKVAVAVTGGQKVQITEDGGETWTSWLLNLPNFSALSVLWDDNGEDGLYVGMDYGVYYIDNTFTEWQPYFTNLPNVIVNELEINYADGKIYAGTYGRGTWASETYYGEIILSNDEVLAEGKVAIYPNPTAGEITIELKDPSETDIRIFDIAGKLMKYEANVAIESKHTVDISNLTTGVYFVRINSDIGTVTKRVIKQ